MQFPDFPIIFTDLPQGARLNIWDSCVEMDYSFADLPPVARTFAYYHELGHIFYNTVEDRDLQTEMRCDEVAAQKMAELGYTRTQIIGALELCLHGSDELAARKLNLLNFLAWMPY